jgi:predicted amidohydrolase YtcJ
VQVGATAKPPDADLALINGKIHTFDDAGTVVSEVLIENGRFVGVGNPKDKAGKDKHDKRVKDAVNIDLRGKTVIPGLIESHIHFVSLGNRPGHHVVIERARNIAEIQELLAARRPSVPAGEFITAMGGWRTTMFAEGRFPTLAELDAAVPDRPVLLFQTGSGPCATNSQGKAFFETVTSPLAGPVAVGADGSIASGLPSTTALYHLRVRQTAEDKVRSAADAMDYAASTGLTALLDQVLPPSPGPLAPTQALSGLDHYRFYDPFLTLHREGKIPIRLQCNFLHNQNDIALPELKERLKNQFQLFGDDRMMTGGIGEWGAPVQPGPVWIEAQRLIAQARWRNENAAASLAAMTMVVEGYEAVDAEFGIRDLRWRIQHGDFATDDLLDRLEALGGGLSMSGHRWLSGTAPGSGGPFRRAVDNGIPVALHQDGVHIAPLNPWFALSYATTGLNVAGVQINAGQQVTRHEALRMMTRGASWFLSREHEIGSIEEGKLADLVVLEKDFTTATDEEFRRMRPVLTVVGGEVAYDAGVIQR